VEPLGHRILHEGGSIKVEPRVMDVLVCLADSRGEVVTREHLRACAWPGTFVGEEAVNSCISKLRRSLDMAGAGKDVVETVPKVGYRISAERLVVAEDSALAERPEKRSRRMLFSVLVVAVATALAVLAVILSG